MVAVFEMAYVSCSHFQERANVCCQRQLQTAQQHRHQHMSQSISDIRDDEIERFTKIGIRIAHIVGKQNLNQRIEKARHELRSFRQNKLETKRYRIMRIKTNCSQSINLIDKYVSTTTFQTPPSRNFSMVR